MENSQGHVGIKGSLLVCLNFFFTSLRLLGQFWRTARKGWDLVGVFFLQNLPLREGRLFWNYPKKGRGWLGVVDFFAFLSTEEGSTPVWLRVSSHTWA